MQSKNPAFIPRNHKVEEALAAAVTDNDLAPVEQLLKVLAKPFDYTQERSEYSEPAPPSDRVYQTFCGT